MPGADVLLHPQVQGIIRLQICVLGVHPLFDHGGHRRMFLQADYHAHAVTIPAKVLLVVQEVVVEIGVVPVVPGPGAVVHP